MAHRKINQFETEISDNTADEMLILSIQK